MADQKQLRALARKVHALEKQQRAMKQPSLSFSTIDDGAITAIDADGTLTMVMGSQYDGTNTAASVTGPVPPIPLSPLISDEMPGGLLVTWDGTFTNALVAPLDFTRVTVHAVTVVEGLTNFDPLIAHPPKGSLSSATGGEVFILSDPGVEMLVVLVAWTESGKFSEESLPSLGTARVLGLNTSDPEWIATQQAITNNTNAAAAAQGDATAAQQSADGKSTIYNATFAPTTEANNAGDSWWFRDVATGNIKGLYQGLGGTSWAGRVLDNQIIANLDAGKITFGSMSGQRIEAGTVIAEKVGADVLIANEVFSRAGYFGEIEAGQITAGDLAAAIAVLGSLSVGTAITIDPTSGIVIRGPLGDTTLPADGSGISLSGEVTALSMTVLGQLGIRGITNEISKGAIVRLATGTTAPQSAPSVTVDHASKAIHEGFESRGFATFSDGKFLSVESVGDATLTRLTEGVDFAHAFESFSLGANGGRTEVTSGLGGAVIIGNVVYVLCQTTEGVPGTFQARWYVYKFTWTSGAIYTFNTRWLYEPETFLGGNSTFRPAIGKDLTSGEILITQCGGTGGNTHISRYTTNGVLNSRQNLRDSAGAGSLSLSKHATGVLAGSFDFGIYRVVTTWENLNHAKAFDSTRNEVPADQFTVPASNTRGILWDGTRFRTRAPTKAYDHTSIRTATSSLSIATTWRKADATGPDFAQYETAISPIRTLPDFPDRSRLVVSTAPIPDDSADPNDADSISVYLSTTLNPTSANFSRAATPAVGIREVTLSTIPAGGIPPTSNTFPAATPAAIQSQVEDANGPLAVMRGNGSGRISDFKADTVVVTGRVTSNELDVGGGKVISGMDYGLRSGSTDANGRMVVPHALGVVPATVIVTGGSTQPRAYYLFSSTSTNFTVQVRALSDGSNVINNASVDVAWFALA